MADSRDGEIKGRVHVISTQMADGYTPPSTSLNLDAPDPQPRHRGQLAEHCALCRSEQLAKET